MEDITLGPFIFQRMHVGALPLHKNQLNHFAQWEYLKYSAWILVTASFYFKWLLLWDYVLSSWHAKYNSVSDGERCPAQTTSWLFWQLKCRHFKAWKLHYFHPNSGCSLMARIGKCVPLIRWIFAYHFKSGIDLWI